MAKDGPAAIRLHKETYAPPRDICPAYGTGVDQRAIDALRFSPG
jgi:hypothetical protein